ncbi:MAG: hypothetical protein WCI31_15940 [Prolixibacteraceae bacterium]
MSHYPRLASDIFEKYFNKVDYTVAYWYPFRFVQIIYFVDIIPESDSYWPEKITSITNNNTLKWIEEHLWFINLSPRDKCFDVLSGTNINEAGAKDLADAAHGLWQAILDKDLAKFGHFFKASFEAQIAMFPHMVTPQITEAIRKYEKQVLGWKISGAGGGGYLVLVSEGAVENAMQVKIRR